MKFPRIFTVVILALLLFYSSAFGQGTYRNVNGQRVRRPVHVTGNKTFGVTSVALKVCAPTTERPGRHDQNKTEEDSYLHRAELAPNV